MIDIRRLLSLAACLFLLMSLSACGLSRTYCLDEIKKDVSFVSGGITIRGTLDFSRDKEMKFSVKEPENISGTVFTENEVSLDDIKINYGKMKDSSPVNILFQILSDLQCSEIKIPLKGEYSYQSSVLTVGYKIIFDCENCQIKSIETEKYTYTFE